MIMMMSHYLLTYGKSLFYVVLQAPRPLPVLMKESRKANDATLTVAQAESCIAITLWQSHQNLRMEQSYGKIGLME